MFTCSGDRQLSAATLSAERTFQVVCAGVMSALTVWRTPSGATGGITINTLAPIGGSGTMPASGPGIADALAEAASREERRSSGLASRLGEKGGTEPK